MPRLRLVSALAAVLTLAALPASAQQAFPSTMVHAEAFGVSGASSVRLERAVATSSDGSVQLRLRAGAAYWPTSRRSGDASARIFVAPLGAAALVSLGRPLGIPSAFEFGTGLYLGGTAEPASIRTDLPDEPSVIATVGTYSEVALRAGLGAQVTARVGASAGLGSYGVRPTLGIGVGL